MQTGQSLLKILRKNNFYRPEQPTADVEASADPTDTSVGVCLLYPCPILGHSRSETAEATAWGKQISLISLVVLCLGVLVAPSPSGAQSSKASTSVQTKLAILDNSLDPLRQVSTSLQVLSKRVSPGVVQIFSTGCKPDGDREHRNTDLLSRGLTSGSGIIIAATSSRFLSSRKE